MAKKIQITLQDDVFENLTKDSKRFGLSRSGYLAQLVMQKNMELSAMRMVNKLTDEQLREQIKMQLDGR
jgi:predicted CopG family antitoxin